MDPKEQLKKKLAVVFTKLDADGNGQVTIEEFKMLLVPNFLPNDEDII